MELLLSNDIEKQLNGKFSEKKNLTQDNQLEHHHFYYAEHSFNWQYFPLIFHYINLSK